MEHCSLPDRLSALSPTLPPKQRKLAEYIANHEKDIAFLTSTALANAANVSESTVIRLSNSLGYKSYSDFQSEIQKIIERELSALDRFKINRNVNNRSIFDSVYASEVSYINKAHRALSQRDFDVAASLFFGKKRILCVGMHGSSCLANYLSYLLMRIRDGVETIYSLNDRTFEYLRNLDEETLAVFLCFPRYPNDLIRIYNAVQKTPAKVLSITNNLLSPVAFADATLIVPIDHLFYNDPFAAAMCTINALVTTLAKMNPELTAQNLSSFEQYVDEFNIYESKEYSFVSPSDMQGD